jgi:hypothetical protein
MDPFIFEDHTEFLRLLALSEPEPDRAAALMAAANYLEFLESSILEELDALFTQLRVDE